MQSKHVKTILNLLMYVIGILLICLLLPKLLKFFMPFVIGWVISLIANPLVKFFEKRLKIVRKHGTWLVIVGVLALVIGACYLVISWLVREGVGFVQNLPEMYSAMVQGFRDIGNNVTVFLTKYNLPVSVNEGISEVLANLDTYIGDLISTLGMPTLSMAGGIVSNLPNLLVQAIFMFLSAYFFVADKEKISAGLRKILPQSLFDRWAWIKRMFSKAVGGYFVAQFKIMGVIAAILFVGFLILRIDYAILWALLIAFLDFIPFLGTGTIIWPWAAFQLATGDYYMAVGLMIIYLICLLVHQLLQPKFVGDTVGMDPLTTLIFMFIGYRFSGVLGMIIAVPVGIIIINLYKAGAFEKIIGDAKSLVEDFNSYRNS
ncbi:MAG: sporulation integral membrane protein YtvI [Lachnospiraceae bacterium]|nr:sporulation integral membrane protein YtvI [Lachnospiraceae bacterium]